MCLTYVEPHFGFKTSVTCYIKIYIRNIVTKFLPFTYVAFVVENPEILYILYSKGDTYML